MEVYGCLSLEYPDLSVKEVINIAVDRYNNTVHLVTKRKPNNISFNKSERINYQSLTDLRSEINKDFRGIIQKNMENMNIQAARKNRKRQKPREFSQGNQIHVAVTNIQSKHKSIYRTERVAKNNRVAVTTESSRRIHKTHIKNSKN